MLRGHDAAQLATALFLRFQRPAPGLPDPLVTSSDVEMSAEGLAVDDPNTH